MFANARVEAALPAVDIERARRFYAEKLDLTPAEEQPGGLRYECGGGTGFFVFPTSISVRGGHTQIGFEVADVEAAVATLRSKGVAFEEYQSGPLATVNGIATDPTSGDRAAWFKDSEGNLVGLVQPA